jgi:hypothetical protein
MSRAFRQLALIVSLIALGALVGGCSAAACDTSDDGNTPERREDGRTVNGIYESSSVHGQLLEFPGGKRYDLVHNLGFEPLVVQMYWSFIKIGVARDAQREEDAGTLTPASGNSALIQLMNDRIIRVKNDSCVEFFLRVVAFGDPRPASDGGAPGDATTSADASADVAEPFALRAPQ